MQTPDGLTFSTTIVVSFHPVFVTKVDRAYAAVCRYGGQIGRASVTNSFSVSMLPTETIQDKITHVWECANIQDNERMWVHDCRVSPEFGEGRPLLDRRGCSLDPVLLAPLTYQSRARAITAHHAYKFPDYPTLLFRCLISVCTMPDCPRLPPSCPSPGLIGASVNRTGSVRKPRDAHLWSDQPFAQLSGQGTKTPAKELVMKIPNKPVPKFTEMRMNPSVSDSSLTEHRMNNPVPELGVETTVSELMIKSEKTEKELMSKRTLGLAAATLSVADLDEAPDVDPRLELEDQRAATSSPSLSPLTAAGLGCLSALGIGLLFAVVTLLLRPAKPCSCGRKAISIS